MSFRTEFLVLSLDLNACVVFPQNFSSFRDAQLSNNVTTSPRVFNQCRKVVNQETADEVGLQNKSFEVLHYDLQGILEDDMTSQSRESP